MVEVNHLKGAQIFENLEAEMLKPVLALFEQRAFAKAETLCRAGDAAEEVFLLLSGRVALTVPISVLMVERELQIENKGPLELVGWSALVPPHIYTLTATGTEGGEMLVVGREALLEHCRAHPSLGFVVMSNVASIIGERLALVKDFLIKEVGRSIQLV